MFSVLCHSDRVVILMIQGMELPSAFLMSAMFYQINFNTYEQ